MAQEDDSDRSRKVTGPAGSPHPRVEVDASSDDPVDDLVYDFVVVGSGAGGGPLAANLALAGFRVAVLEAGFDHDCRYYDIPVMQARASEDPKMAWNFYVSHYDDPQRGAQDSKWVEDRGGILYPRGGTLGGSTAVNAMVHIAPHPDDWNALARLTGDQSWSADRMRTLFERIETWEGVDAAPLPGDSERVRDDKARHGRHGWLSVTRAHPELASREPRFLDVINATEETSRELFGIAEDISLPRDINAADTSPTFEGMSFVPAAVRRGRRNGTRERLQDVAGAHPDRLHLITDTLVTRILFEDDRAVGVEYQRGRHLYRASPLSQDADGPAATGVVRARLEVIVAGGVFNTPQLLMLSGIGPKSELDRLGIPLVCDLPGVGQNLHDRYEVAVVSELDADYPIFEGSSLDVTPPAAAPDDLMQEWETSKTGPYSTNGTLAAIVTRTSAATSDDTDLILFSLPADFHGYYPGYSAAGAKFHDRLSVLILKGYTRDRAGSVRLRSTDPRDVPDIRLRYFDEGSAGWETDLEGVVDGVEVARRLTRHLKVATATREVVPGEHVATREQLRDFVKREAWGHHACGTAKIGADDDPNAVVDGDFRVRGVQGLRVVDASVFPDIPGFFIVSAVYMVSEKASDVLVAAHRWRLGESASVTPGH